MQPLEKTLRNQLERTVKEARDVAESAARAAVEQLGIKEATAYSHLSAEDKELRRKLRAHGRQLGDWRNDKGLQETDRLVEEIAYEHWHRMLFARFLAENNLLMYPDPVDPVSVSLAECEDLAGDEGAKNGWELAASYATRMLPQIFRVDSPVFKLELPPEHQQTLERLVSNLPQEVFTASDSLGWVYQFWQAKKKDEVNASEVKIGARELPAVTQLFTEPYMVSFLLDNSLGAWWAARRLTETDLKTSKSEEELRSKASLPGVPLGYLRFVQLDDGDWTPAAGTFDSWPENLSELKTLDPCCGSGHFLVAAFLMLVPMRIEMEGLSALEAVDAVLRENIHGLEIDQRCVELAAFALALTAWAYPKTGGYRPLPELKVACSGLAISAKKEDWLALAGDKSNLRIALEYLYGQFKDAPLFGSLINPEMRFNEGTLFEIKENILPLLNKALVAEKDVEKTEIGVVAQGLLHATNILSRKYTLISTNVPFLGKNDQSPPFRAFLEQSYPSSCGNLATSFIERCKKFVTPNGSIALVTIQDWLFLNLYEKLRKRLLDKMRFESIVKMGSKAFSTQMWDFNTMLIIATSTKANSNNCFFGLDISIGNSPEEKNDLIMTSEFSLTNQYEQYKNPKTAITFSTGKASTLLGKAADSFTGVQTGDDPRYRSFFWEINMPISNWRFDQGTVSKSLFYGGRQYILRWENNGQELKHTPGAYIRGAAAWKKKGVSVSQMQNLPVTLYTGEAWNMNCATIIPKCDTELPALWTYCSSDLFSKEVRRINQSLKVNPGYFLRIPFDLDHWQEVAEEKYPNGLPKPFSNDPTQWIFHGHPVQSDSPLQVAIARLFGYRWPAELDASMELADEQREWAKKSQELLHFADEDGIVCIPPVRGETSAADRLLNLLAAAYGEAWSSDILAMLLKNADHAGKTLETWIRDKFFTQHCKLFQHRSFIWHIWDGLPDGFATLVNYHKLDRKNLETLIYTYLGDWISRQKQDIVNKIDGAQGKLAAAESLKKKLELILEGESPYDIFVRWKSIEKQSIGWDPDLNDGVRLNIRPFMTVPDVGKKGAGVLRDKPNIHWNKDRGKDVESAPWFNLGPEYGGKKGDRINDHHLSLQEKRAVRKF